MPTSSSFSPSFHHFLLLLFFTLSHTLFLSFPFAPSPPPLLAHPPPPSPPLRSILLPPLSSPSPVPHLVTAFFLLPFLSPPPNLSSYSLLFPPSLSSSSSLFFSIVFSSLYHSSTTLPFSLLIYLQLLPNLSSLLSPPPHFNLFVLRLIIALLSVTSLSSCLLPSSFLKHRAETLAQATATQSYIMHELTSSPSSSSSSSSFSPNQTQNGSCRTCSIVSFRSCTLVWLHIT